MLLAIHAQGLGGVLIGEILNQTEDVFAALSLDPGGLEFMWLIALGRPAAAGASTRMELNAFLLEEF